MSARHRTRDGASTIVMLRDEVTLPAAMHLTQRLGKYTITDTLGEGAMGVVYRALDPHIDRVVAIKTIRKHLLDGPNGHHDAALRFRNEARAAGRLTHPGIVSIYDYGEENGQGYIVMQYVEGASLLRGTASPADRLPLADVLSVATQLLHALNYAHAHGVWHRDIKPSNLIVTAGGQLKITDFGIARIDAHALTQDATVMGSTGYMAPECYQGVELDQRVDIFACGVLLYELLTGCRPFKGVPGAVMHQMLYEEMPSLVATARDDAEAVLLAPFEPIVACAMAKDRSRRYPGAQEMLDALTAVAGKTVAARVSVAAVQALMAPRAAARTQVAAASPAQAATSNVPSAAPTATAPAAPLAADAAPTDAAATLPAADPMATPARIHMLPRKPQPIHRRVDADGAVATPSPESAVTIEAAPTVQAEAPAVVPVTLQAAVPVPAASVPATNA